MAILSSLLGRGQKSQLSSMELIYESHRHCRALWLLSNLSAVSASAFPW